MTGTTITARRLSAGWYIDGLPDRDGRPLYLYHADVRAIRALHTGGALPVGASTRGGQVGGNAVTRLHGWKIIAREAGMPPRVTLTSLGVQVAHAIQEVES